MGTEIRKTAKMKVIIFWYETFEFIIESISSRDVKNAFTYSIKFMCKSPYIF